ncbi:MAG: M48 family metallopeptidase [Pseudobdellovibrio sp.]
MKIFEANYDGVDILDDKLILNCVFPEDFNLKKSLLMNWYLNKATEILHERFDHYTEIYEQNDVELSVKKLTKRWGEFHLSKNLVVLNAELVVAPMECIDYVIIHELCHALILDHSPNFYKLLLKRLPTWKHLKNSLEAHSIGFGPIV